MRTANFVTTQGAGVPATTGLVDAPGRREVRQLWVGTLRTPWRSLLLLPVSPGASMLALARGLVEVGSQEANAVLHLVDGTGCPLAVASQLGGDIAERLEAGTRVVATCDSLVENESGVPLALGADAVVLGISLGRTTLRELRRTRELLGEATVVGSVLLPWERPE